jgi:hypothetical protein
MDQFEELWGRDGFQSVYRDWRNERSRFVSDFEPEVASFMSGSVGTKDLCELSTKWEGQ